MYRFGEDFWAALPDAGRHAKQRSAQDLCFTAGDGIRTHDVQLGKLAFYH